MTGVADVQPSRPAVSQAAFDELRDTHLGLSESLGLEVTDMTFAQASSWAVWAQPSPAMPGISWSHDYSVLESYDALAETIRADAVFVALNKGTNPSVANEKAWMTFHSGRRDYMLAEALRSAAGGMHTLWGSYMTDFYKGLPTRSGAELEAFLDTTVVPSREQVEAVMCELFETELRLLGAADPLLVCLGGDVFDVVSRLLPNRRRAKLTHYAATISKVAYAAEVTELCRSIAGTSQ